MSAEQQDASADAKTRENKRARLLTPAYRLSRHVGLFIALALAPIAVGVWLVDKARARDLWIVPAYLAAANVVEYLVHRLLMHRPLWPRRLYRGHTLGHHRAFHHDSMEVGSWRELELVMMPQFTVLLLFVGMAPTVALVNWTLGPGAAGLWALTAVGTFVSYEGLHALYHLPRPALRRFGFLGSRAFNYLYRHHLHHHRLLRMRWTNFNISLPLSDWVFGTLEDEASWRAERRSTQADVVEARARAKAQKAQLDVVRAGETGGADGGDEIDGGAPRVAHGNRA